MIPLGVAGEPTRALASIRRVVMIRWGQAAFLPGWPRISIGPPGPHHQVFSPVLPCFLFQGDGRTARLPATNQAHSTRCVIGRVTILWTRREGVRLPSEICPQGLAPGATVFNILTGRCQPRQRSLRRSQGFSSEPSRPEPTRAKAAGRARGVAEGVRDSFPRRVPGNLHGRT